MSGFRLSLESILLVGRTGSISEEAMPNPYSADLRERVLLVLCQPCSDAFRADLLPRGMAAGGGGGEAVPGDVDSGGA